MVNGINSHFFKTSTNGPQITMKFNIQVFIFIASATGSSVSSHKLRGATTERSLDSVCTNTADYAQVDEGCRSDLPMCFLNDGNQPSAQVMGDYCGKCINTVDSDTETDMGCMAAAPRCNAALGLGGMECLALPMSSRDTTPCVNNAPFGELDEACTSEFPLCARLDGNEPAADVAGDYCGKCRNIWDTDTVPDLGCTATEPHCDAELGLIGMQCLPPEVVPTPACKNTGAFGAKDEGCTDEAPICHDATSHEEVGSYATGTGCARCLNSFDTAYHQYGLSDYGCPNDQPRCAMTDGSDPYLTKVGSRCCPADGCPVVNICPCDQPDSLFNYVVNLSQVTYPYCATGEKFALVDNVNFSGGWLGAGEYYPDFWMCFSRGDRFVNNIHYGITPDEGLACLAMLQAVITENEVQCVPAWN